MSGFTDLRRAGPLQFSRPEWPSREAPNARILLSFRSFDHTGEAGYNAYHYLIRDACGADF
jgi:hypothetical protein